MTAIARCNWIAVACAEHVQRGHAGGFMQVCHGKAAPLRRVQPGDRVIYYSPTLSFRRGGKLQAFTALGVVQAGDVYQVDMGGGFSPFRRNVAWRETHDAPIAPLLDVLAFTRGKTNWGGVLRFGLLKIDEGDSDVIAAAMGAAPAAATAAA